MPDTMPMMRVTNIVVGVTNGTPMTSSCSSSSKAGNENTAMNTSGAMRLYRNIFIPLPLLVPRS